jgi:hypothetical protein
VREAASLPVSPLRTLFFTPQEDEVARPSYKSEKRKKELARQKKQEEKRQKRFNKTHEPDGAPLDAATLEGLGLLPPGAASTSPDQTEAAADASSANGTEGAPTEEKPDQSGSDA